MVFNMSEFENVIETIGKIKLDLTYYPGEDFYCDGTVEDQLLDIAEKCSEVEFPRIIEEKKSWPIMYHLSHIRENIVEWLPITKEMKVLEIGAGCGAITGALSRKAGEVTCIDLSKKRSMINAYRHMDCDNVTIRVGNFMDVEKALPNDYDMICLIGVFEYGQAYTGGKTPYEDLLNLIKRHLKSNGRIVIAIENKFGLKYWAGCREDHLGTFFSGIQDYPAGGVVRTFTADGLKEIAKRCGLDEIQMFYPYPDYKFMTNLYSDKRLPYVGELKTNRNNYDRDRLQLFDEKLVFDAIIKEKQFPLFSNSYCMILGPKIDTSFVRYSNDRDAAYGIKTEISEINGEKRIRKYALKEQSKEHIANIYNSYQMLSKRYAGGKLSINKAELAEDGSYISLEYVEGDTLESILDHMLEQDDLDGFQKMFEEYLERIAYGEDCDVTDYDLIFSNIIVNGDVWTVIDYEWTVPRFVPSKEIAFRALYCYLLEGGNRNKLNYDLIIDMLGFSEEELEELRAQELTFQKGVTGDRMALGELHTALGNKEYTVDELLGNLNQKDFRGRIQIYEDTGKGFSEEESYFLSEDELQEEGFYKHLVGRKKALRIDPCSDYCIVYLKNILWNNETIPVKGKMVTHNGFRIGDNTYAFDTQDPNFTIQLDEVEVAYQNDLIVYMEVTRIPEKTAKHLKKRGLFS